MPRNLDRRIEVAFPIYDPAIQQQIQELVDIQLTDNTKARVLLPDNTGVINHNGKPPLRAQEALYEVACRMADRQLAIATCSLLFAVFVLPPAPLFVFFYNLQMNLKYS
jgi:polyphosphate kinase